MSTPQSEGPLVDCHAHVWRLDMPLVADAWKRPEYAYTAENFIADLDAHGVRYGVIAAASLFGNNNAYSLQVLQSQPRLRATANVPLHVDRQELLRLQRAGICGVRLQWFFLEPLPDLAGVELQSLCRNLRELGMHIHININGARLVHVAGALAETGVKLVIDHFGWHDPALRLDAPSYRGMLRLMERGNVWVKMTSAYRHPDDHYPDWSLPVAYAQDLLQRFGTERLLWGSDAPFIGHEQVASYALAVQRYCLCVPDAAARRAIGENAWRFYFSPDAGG